MTEFLVLLLDPSERDVASWVPVDQTGALLGTVSRGPLAVASPMADGRRLIVLVPTLDVLRTTVDVPLKGVSKVLQALPFALEEQLAEDVDQLHFAAGARTVDGRVPAAVVRREVMDDWQQRLVTAGLRPDRMYAESDAIGCTPNTVSLLLQDASSVLAEPDGTLTGVDPEGTEGMLDLWGARRGASGEPEPVHMVVYGRPELLARFEPIFDRLRSKLESLDLRQLPDGPLPRLAAQIVTAPGVNLLQGTYAPQSGLLALWPAWRMAASLALALAGTVLLVQFAELRGLRRQVADVDGAIDQAFHHVFPDAGPIQDARAQLSSRLRALGSQGPSTSHEFLDVLNVVAQSLSEVGARVEAVNYRVGSMELRVRAPTVESLDRVQQAVARTGTLKAQIQSANASGEQVVGRLQISRTGG